MRRKRNDMTFDVQTNDPKTESRARLLEPLLEAAERYAFETKAAEHTNFDTQAYHDAELALRLAAIQFAKEK
jgi:hypothetical protein